MDGLITEESRDRAASSARCFASYSPGAVLSGGTRDRRSSAAAPGQSELEEDSGFALRYTVRLRE